MKIVLNNSLSAPGPRKPIDNESLERFASYTGRAAFPQERNLPPVEGVYLNEDSEALAEGFLATLAYAYSKHEKIVLAPHDIWFIVLGEIATAVNAAPEKYTKFFTSSPEKQKISVPTNDPTAIGPVAVINELRSKINLPLEMFLPELSTADRSARTAMAAMFCDTVKSYYSYMTYCCGIPEIKVTGTIQDWTALVESSRLLQGAFLGDRVTEEMATYMGQVHDRLREILWHVCSEPDAAFWSNIFTTKNIGSGGQLEISGWIKDFYFGSRPNQLENFTRTMAVLPYTSLDTGRSFVAVHGAFSQTRDDEGFLQSSYGHVVFETK